MDKPRTNGCTPESRQLESASPWSPASRSSLFSQNAQHSRMVGLIANATEPTSFHGHHHDRLDYSGEDWLGFRAFGVGLHGITDLDGKVIVEGEQDLLRLHHRRVQPK